MGRPHGEEEPASCGENPQKFGPVAQALNLTSSYISAECEKNAADTHRIFQKKSVSP